jgi:hypothetical protein
MRRLEFIQVLPVTVDLAWEFFSNPSNLGKITPKEMNFVITSELPGKAGCFTKFRLV